MDKAEGAFILGKRIDWKFSIELTPFCFNFSGESMICINA